MKLPKEKYAAAAREGKRRLKNSLTKAQKVAVDAERLRKTQRTACRNSERLRAMTETRSATGAEGLAAKASRISTRRKLHPLRVDEKVEKARAKAKKRSATSTDFLAVEASWLSAHRKSNPSTGE